jgi:hypothetical protein
LVDGPEHLRVGVRVLIPPTGAGERVVDKMRTGEESDSPLVEIGLACGALTITLGVRVDRNFKIVGVCVYVD